MSVTAIDHLVLTVVDMAETIAFYSDVLGMTAQSFTGADGVERQALKFGRQKINLHQSGREIVPHAATPMPGSADLCFLTEKPLEWWVAHLDKLGVDLLDGPVPRTGAVGPITSLYFRDPSGNLIEVSTYG